MRVVVLGLDVDEVAGAFGQWVGGAMRVPTRLRVFSAAGLDTWAPRPGPGPAEERVGEVEGVGDRDAEEGEDRVVLLTYDEVVRHPLAGFLVGMCRYADTRLCVVLPYWARLPMWVLAVRPVVEDSVRKVLARANTPEGRGEGYGVSLDAGRAVLTEVGVSRACVEELIHVGSVIVGAPQGALRLRDVTALFTHPTPGDVVLGDAEIGSLSTGGRVEVPGRRIVLVGGG